MTDSPIPAPGADSITTTEPDALYTRQAWIFGILAVILAGWGVFEFTRSSWAPGTIFLAAGALAAFQAWTAYTTKDSVMTVDASGISRKGGWGWKLPWDQIASATVEDHAGQDFLVVARNWDAPNHHSATLRFSSPFAKNALVNPLPYDRRDEVAAVVARHLGTPAG